MVPSMAFCNYEEIIVAKLGKFFCNFVRFYYAINTFMEKHNFEHLPEHTKAHNYFVAKVKSLLTREIDDEQEETLQEITDFLSQWVSTHIMFEDRKYTAIFK